MIMFTDEFSEFVNKKLVTDGIPPETFVGIASSELDVSKESIDEFIREQYSLTNSPGRRSFDYCLRCNPHLNGSHGKDGTEAVAKHYIPDVTESEQFITGWEGLCRDCAEKMKENSNVDLKPLPGNEDLPLFKNETIQESSEEIVHECSDPEWEKLSLVTEPGGFDWMECKKCGIQGKKHTLNSVEVVGYDKR